MLKFKARKRGARPEGVAGDKDLGSTSIEGLSLEAGRLVCPIYLTRPILLHGKGPQAGAAALRASKMPGSNVGEPVVCGRDILLQGQ